MGQLQKAREAFRDLKDWHSGIHPHVRRFLQSDEPLDYDVNKLTPGMVTKLDQQFEMLDEFKDLDDSEPKKKWAIHMCLFFIANLVGEVIS